MEMEGSPSSSGSLRHRLRATVCCCFGAGGLGDRMQWRRRASGGEFRYDPLSYALNFDEGADDDHQDDADADVDGGLLYRRLSPLLRARTTTPAAVAVA